MDITIKTSHTEEVCRNSIIQVNKRHRFYVFGIIELTKNDLLKEQIYANFIFITGSGWTGTIFYNFFIFAN